METQYQLTDTQQIDHYLQSHAFELADSYEFSYDCGTRFFHYQVPSVYTYDFQLNFYLFEDGNYGIYHNHKNQDNLFLYTEQATANSFYCDLLQDFKDAYPNFNHCEN